VGIMAPLFLSTISLSSRQGTTTLIREMAIRSFI